MSDTDPTSGAVQAHLLPHVNNPVGMTAAPGDAKDLFIVNFAGEIDVLDTKTDQLRSTRFLTLPASMLGTGGERGLEAITFDPNYQANGQFYVSLAAPNGDFQVWRYTRSASDPTVADPSSGSIILSIPHSNTQHYAGWLAFGPDGDLYVATGDNDVGPVPTNPAADPSSLLGKILRIDVHSDGFPNDPTRNYAIPADNPFLGVAGAAPEVFAAGLRNPWRGTFDPGTGNLYIADVGENSQEELDLIPAGSRGGQNFGWPTQEGNLGPGGSGFTAPILTYDHGSGLNQGDCIIGGYVYRGPGGADGLYIYGDFSVPNLWAADIENGQVKSIVNLDDELQVDGGSLSAITSFGLDAQGRLYVSTVFGALYRLDFSASAAIGPNLLPPTLTHHTAAGSAQPDFNGDGKGDLFWKNANGALSVWELNDTAAPSGVNLPGAAGWQAQDTGDFNGDGYSGDLLLRNTSTGMVDIWTDNAGQMAGADVTKVDLGWQIMGTADFNGDGKSDILWRNEQNGYVSIWQMDGSTVTTTDNPGQVGLEWKIVGAGDFVGDGKAEILWRDTSTGEIDLWTIDGPGPGQTHGVKIASLGLEWQVAGTGDFNGDGTADILWSDSATGQVVIWEMNGAQVLVAQPIGNPGPQWKVVGVTDLNGDGKADILWRDSNSGQVVAWVMNGFTVDHYGVLGTADAAWQTINHHYDWA